MQKPSFTSPRTRAAPPISQLLVKEGFGIAGLPGSVDFRDHGADVSNEYFLARLRYRVGYTDKWWGTLVEGQSSFVVSDQRFASTVAPARRGDGPESDTVDLHQA